LFQWNRRKGWKRVDEELLENWDRWAAEGTKWYANSYPIITTL